VLKLSSEVSERKPLVGGVRFKTSGVGVDVIDGNTDRAFRQLKRQGLPLVHFSAQLEPYLTQEDTLHTLNTP